MSGVDDIPARHGAGLCTRRTSLLPNANESAQFPNFLDEVGQCDASGASQLRPGHLPTSLICEPIPEGSHVVTYRGPF